MRLSTINLIIQRFNKSPREKVYFFVIWIVDNYKFMNLMNYSVNPVIESL